MKLQNAGIIDFMGTKLTLRTLSGIVKEKAERTTSHVESTRNGYGNLTRVKMSTEQHQEIWLEMDSGEEVRLSIGGVAIPMRNGHRLQAFFAAQGAERGALVAVKNLTTGEFFETFNKYQRLPSVGLFKLSLLHTLGAGPLSFLCVAGAFVCGGILTVVGIPFSLGAWAAGLAIGGGFAWQHSAASQAAIHFRNELARAIATVAQPVEEVAADC
ncbi:hypothetical protein DIE23_21610 [Burkholderia sp. Bp9143]|uniref:hypothetical protein n=1 Tax=Burkholderia sp. Bp9143 TaxID=2184574 RepID=UPI000F59835A|nr:hypothetical protein [Burkholderia sp. Bp9143]RQR29505.1 hypothetical protein DIE23_21610 [Burkholderia sp. Bp9143]